MPVGGGDGFLCVTTATPGCCPAGGSYDVAQVRYFKETALQVRMRDDRIVQTKLACVSNAMLGDVELSRLVSSLREGSPLDLPVARALHMIEGKNRILVEPAFCHLNKMKQARDRASRT